MFFFFQDPETKVPCLQDVTPADIRATGEAVYGPMWHRQMTDRIIALRQNSGPIASTAVYAWAAGERRIPAYVSAMLGVILDEGEADLKRRLAAIQELRRRVKPQIAPEVTPPRSRRSR